jgi:putative oxidoreductase
MTTLDAVLLVVRAVLGVTFLIHGGQKLFGWYGGGGTRGTQEMMGMLGVGHPRLMGWLATLSEFFGGLLVLIGLFTQLAAAIIIGTMIVAVATVHLSKGFLNTAGGYELNLSLITLALVLLFLGPGSISLDHLMGFDVPIHEMPMWAIILLILVPFGGLILTQLSKRMKAPEQSDSFTNAGR